MNQVSPTLPPQLAARLMRPTVRLSGSIDEGMVQSFLAQVLPVLDVEGAIVVELYTPGGDPEVARRLAEEVRLLTEAQGREMWFVGKTLVASAGATVMAAFPRERRWMTRDATLFLHGRRMWRDVRLDGPLGSCRRVLEEIMADIDQGLRVEDETFADLVEGSLVTLENVRQRAYGGWYLTAKQALDAGLIGGVV
jgi:ATP-dependent protease ClpP protease subunit